MRTVSAPKGALKVTWGPPEGQFHTSPVFCDSLCYGVTPFSDLGASVWMPRGISVHLDPKSRNGSWMVASKRGDVSVKTRTTKVSGLPSHSGCSSRCLGAWKEAGALLCLIPHWRRAGCLLLPPPRLPSPPPPGPSLSAVPRRRKNFVDAVAVFLEDCEGALKYVVRGREPGWGLAVP